MAIEVSSLTKIYGTQKAVDDISFAIEGSEIVGFLGPNGAGKSTTMKMITGFVVPDKGHVKVNGLSSGKDDLAIKKNIGYLSEANPLYYDMYVKEYLGFIGAVHGVKNLTARVDEVISITGLTTEKTKKAAQLSKGYKQRLGLAAALIHDPKVLILDEPTTGLDPNQIIEIRELIKELGLNKTVLFSSHILQEVEAICKRVIIINKGKIVADDLLQNLVAKKKANYIKLSLQESLETEWFSRLTSVLSIEKQPNNTWLLQTNNEELTRKQVLEMSVRHNLNIVSLQTEGSSLEDIFRLLTKNK